MKRLLLREKFRVSPLCALSSACHPRVAFARPIRTRAKRSVGWKIKFAAMSSPCGEYARRSSRDSRTYFRRRRFPVSSALFRPRAKNLDIPISRLFPTKNIRGSPSHGVVAPPLSPGSPAVTTACCVLHATSVSHACFIGEIVTRQERSRTSCHGSRRAFTWFLVFRWRLTVRLIDRNNYGGRPFANIHHPEISW